MPLLAACPAMLMPPDPLRLAHSMRAFVLQLRVECIAGADVWDVEAVPPEVAAGCAETCVGRDVSKSFEARGEARVGV